MLFSGLALTCIFVQNLTKNIKSIFSIFLNLFLFGKKSTREKGKAFFLKLTTWVDLTKWHLFCLKVLRSRFLNI